MTALSMDRAVRSPSSTRYFYVWMGAAFIAIAFGGFLPTYWLKLADGTFSGAPVVHIHGALFFAWTLYYFSQSLLVARGSLRSHRAWGMAGISLATLMVATAILASINSMKSADALGMHDLGLQFSIVSLSSAVVFSAFIALAIANTARPETHKRLMVLATVVLMQPAIARVFRTIVAPDAVGPPPVAVSIPPGLLACALIGAALVYDWRTRGRPHRVYVIGGAVIVAVMVLRLPLSTTTAWMSIARFVEALAG